MYLGCWWLLITSGRRTKDFHPQSYTYGGCIPAVCLGLVFIDPNVLIPFLRCYPSHDELSVCRR